MFEKSNVEHLGNHGKVKPKFCKHGKQASYYGCYEYWIT